MDYWQKLPDPDQKISDILDWGIPEQKTGRVTIIGGSSSNVTATIKCAEFLNSLPLKSSTLLLPDALRTKIPPVPGVNFAPSTESGSFAKSNVLNDAFSGTDFVLISGDLSKNSATAIAFSDAIKASSAPVFNFTSTAAATPTSVAQTTATTPQTKPTPILLARDAVDLLSESASDFIERENIFLVASLAQLQKLFRALLYPRMILLSQPLMPIIESIHKFTLTYPDLTILTFHANTTKTAAPGQIIIAHSGKIITIPLDHTSYTPISLWSGTLACKIAALSLWAPSDPLLTTAAAVFWNGR